MNLRTLVLRGVSFADVFESYLILGFYCVIFSCNFSIDVRKADHKEGATAPMNQVSLHFLKIQEDVAQLYKDQIRGMLLDKCVRPLETILSLSALVTEKEKIVKSSTLDCDHFKSKKESELLSGKLSDHPSVVKLTEQLNEAERIVASETLAVMNFFDRIDFHMATMLGPEMAVLVGTLQHTHSSSAHLLSQLNKTLPTSAATLCELSALFEEQKASLKSPRLVQPDAEPVFFPAVSSHVQFLNVDIFSPLQQLQSQHASEQENSFESRRLSKSMTPELDLNAPEKSGPLKKKNKMFWGDRWFELRKPGVLTWYKNAPEAASRSGGSKDETAARNHLRMCDVTAIEYTAPSCNITLELEGRGKTYELFAAGEDLAAEWYAALIPWWEKSTDAASTSDKQLNTFLPNADTETEMLSPPPPPRPPRPVSLSLPGSTTAGSRTLSSVSKRASIGLAPPLRPVKPPSRREGDTL